MYENKVVAMMVRAEKMHARGTEGRSEHPVKRISAAVYCCSVYLLMVTEVRFERGKVPVC